MAKKTRAAQIRKFKAGKAMPARVARRHAQEAAAEADYRSARAQARARNRRTSS